MAKKTKRKVSSVGQTTETVDPVEVVKSNGNGAPAAPRTSQRRVTYSQDFNPDYSYVRNDLKRIGILAGTFFVLLIALAFVMPLILP